MNIDFENISSSYVTVGGVHKKVSKIFETVSGVWTKVYDAHSPIVTIKYNTNGGVFDDGSTLNNIRYDRVETIREVTKISKTSNVSDDGLSYNTSGYGDSQAITDVVKIDGATSITVNITYQTESTSYDWVCLYDKSIIPSANNYGSSISGKLGNTTKQTKTFTINDDTVKIFFRSDGSVSNYYGYYATITGVAKTIAFEYLNGVEKIPTRDGYVFAGWYFDEECTDGNQFNLDNVIKTTNIYAKWINASLYELLQDFEFVDNGNDTYTLVSWLGTYNGKPSTELVIPDDPRIIL